MHVQHVLMDVEVCPYGSLNAVSILVQFPDFFRFTYTSITIQHHPLERQGRVSFAMLCRSLRPKPTKLSQPASSGEALVGRAASCILGQRDWLIPLGIQSLKEQMLLSRMRMGIRLCCALAPASSCNVAGFARIIFSPWDRRSAGLGALAPALRLSSAGGLRESPQSKHHNTARPAFLRGRGPRVAFGRARGSAWNWADGPCSVSCRCRSVQ